MKHIKPFNENSNNLIQKYQSDIKKLKDDLLNEIINSVTISKKDKLRMISDNDLFKTDCYICDPFHDRYWDQYASIVGKNSCIDSYFHNRDYDRHEKVDLADLVEDVEDDSNLDPSQRTNRIIIYTNRTTKEVFKISNVEFIDTIYEWCIKNKKIGFEIDW
jgi:hypothetical protein